MVNKQIKRTSMVPLVVLGIFLMLLGAGVYIVKTVLSDDSPQKKNSFSIVTIVKPPPPPPQIKEKPPEPEIKDVQKKEEIYTPTEEDKPAGEKDDTPAGDQLGVDAEGAAGGDAFGLVGKKGGRSLLAGGGMGGNGLGRLSLLSKYAFYTQMVESEIRKSVLKQIDEKGGAPKGKLQAIVRMSLDAKGTIVKFQIVGSSGNTRMDEAISQTISNTRISEPPPEGMPRTMTIKIVYSG